MSIKTIFKELSYANLIVIHEQADLPYLSEMYESTLVQGRLRLFPPGLDRVGSVVELLAGIVDALLDLIPDVTT